jgi:hypothetical protein
VGAWASPDSPVGRSHGRRRRGGCKDDDDEEDDDDDGGADGAVGLIEPATGSSDDDEDEVELLPPSAAAAAASENAAAAAAAAASAADTAAAGMAAGEEAAGTTLPPSPLELSSSSSSMPFCYTEAALELPSYSAALAAAAPAAPAPAVPAPLRTPVVTVGGVPLSAPLRTLGSLVGASAARMAAPKRSALGAISSGDANKATAAAACGAGVLSKVFAGPAKTADKTVRRSVASAVAAGAGVTLMENVNSY